MMIRESLIEVLEQQKASHEEQIKIINENLEMLRSEKNVSVSGAKLKKLDGVWDIYLETKLPEFGHANPTFQWVRIVSEDTRDGAITRLDYIIDKLKELHDHC